MDHITVITVTTKPGMRFQGIEHLKKVAAWIQEKYGIRTEVLGNLHGAIYRNHVVSRYDSLAHMEETSAKILSDPEYLAWFKEGSEILRWEDSSQTIFQVF